jgi:hypothetical protein
MSANPVAPQASATTCIVGCKLPHGLHMQIKAKDGTMQEHVLKGNNASRIIGGYGLTDDVPTEFMMEWLKRNSRHPAVLNGSIFMHDSVAGATARAKEGRDIRSGAEPIDPIAHARKFKLEPDAEAVKAYEGQKRDNPVRNRQIVE